MDETVLTSRRVWLRTPGGTVPARLRLTGSELRLETAGGRVAAVPLAGVVSVRLVRLPRAGLEVRTAAERLRFRCFAPAAVLGLILGARSTGP